MWSSSHHILSFQFFSNRPTSFVGGAIIYAICARIGTWYKDNGVADRLQSITPMMLQQPKKAPKLRGYAATTRALVPFACELAEELLSAADPVENAARVGVYHLGQCYQALRHSSFFASDILREHSTKFALQYVSLEAAHAGTRQWRIKPKLHLFLELCSEGSKPALFWTYRDEDFGGTVSRMARRAGGLCSAHGMSKNVLERFRMLPMVRVR